MSLLIELQLARALDGTIELVSRLGEGTLVRAQGRGVVTAVLLRMAEQIARLEKRVDAEERRIAELERKSHIARRGTRRSRRVRIRRGRRRAGQGPVGSHAPGLLACEAVHATGGSAEL